MMLQRRAVYIALTLSGAFLAIVAGCDRQKSHPEPLTPCGGIGNFVCPSAYYCDLGVTCGGIDHDGHCKRRPVDCDSDLDEVCGCDGKTYRNSCYAASVGMTVQRPGPCE